MRRPRSVDTRTRGTDREGHGSADGGQDGIRDRPQA